MFVRSLGTHLGTYLGTYLRTYMCCLGTAYVPKDRFRSVHSAVCNEQCAVYNISVHVFIHINVYAFIMSIYLYNIGQPRDLLHDCTAYDHVQVLDTNYRASSLFVARLLDGVRRHRLIAA